MFISELTDNKNVIKRDIVALLSLNRSNKDPVKQRQLPLAHKLQVAG